MEDVPLGEQAQGASASATDTTKPKSNTLKRLLKLGKRSSAQTQSEMQLQTLDGISGPEKLSDAMGSKSASGVENVLNDKDSKSSLRRRFQLRLRTPPKLNVIKNPLADVRADATDALEGATPPAPNPKPTLKSSLSTYWRTLFKRHQSGRKTDKTDAAQVGSDADMTDGNVAGAAGGAELEVSNATLPDVGDGAAGISEEKNGNGGVADIIEKMQELAVSEEVEEDQPSDQSQQQQQQQQTQKTATN